jgi:hypothetical protein
MDAYLGSLVGHTVTAQHSTQYCSPGQGGWRASKRMSYPSFSYGMHQQQRCIRSTTEGLEHAGPSHLAMLATGHPRQHRHATLPRCSKSSNKSLFRVTPVIGSVSSVVAPHFHDKHTVNEGVLQASPQTHQTR